MSVFRKNLESTQTILVWHAEVFLSRASTMSLSNLVKDDREHGQRGTNHTSSCLSGLWQQAYCGPRGRRLQILKLSGKEVPLSHRGRRLEN